MRKPAAILGSLLFLIIAPGGVGILVPWWISRWRVEGSLAGGPVLRVVGTLLVVVGTLVILDCFARFALQGLGTPAPVLPTRRLVVTGLYRYVRNPMYLAVVSLIVGQGLLLGSVRVLAYGAAVWLAFHVFVLLYEEPTLRASFEAEYERLCANVPRWRPRVHPWNERGR